ncbi:hypothetical protein [Sphingobacterium siyangense]|jgi:hypothetical protein|uniref:hypothetical protein n=1 Tax=Sphingobacterium siyangense TaxID=459529 RepID=UPI0028AA09FC|nr:hypothetical protein [Sphingobacterium siyangense]
MNHIESIDKGLREKKPHNEIIRKVYLTYPTNAFIGNEEQQYEILDEISQYFDIPINHIQVCGSSKVGRSFHKKSSFQPKVSDLDIAIIDPILFIKYCEIVYKTTNGFQDYSKFKRGDFPSYTEYVSKGIFRPDLMPTCSDRVAWFKFFNTLSLKHDNYFKSINAGIYQSQAFFEYKQIKNIKNYIKNG